MATFVNDTMNDTDGVTLASHTGETGAAWTKHPSYAGTNDIANDGTVSKCIKRYSEGDGSVGVYYASGSPAAADYPVQGDCVVIDTGGGVWILCGRMDASAQTFYYVGRDQSDGSNQW